MIFFRYSQQCWSLSRKKVGEEDTEERSKAWEDWVVKFEQFRHKSETKGKIDKKEKKEKKWEQIDEEKVKNVNRFSEVQGNWQRRGHEL